MGRFLAAGRGTAGHLKEGECLSKDLRKEMDGHQKRLDGMPQTSNNPFRFVSRPCHEVNEICEIYVLFFLFFYKIH